MVTTRIEKAEEVSIVSAIETLARIADLELSSILLDPLMVAPSRDETVVISTVRWLHKKNAEVMMTVVKEKLRVVLQYCRHMFHQDRGQAALQNTLEGVRTIMLLVDEAVENVDRYTKLFLGRSVPSIKDSKEFFELCTFYKRKIVPITTNREIASWISRFSIQDILARGTGTQAPKAFFAVSAELQSIKSDIDYELLSIKRADGTRFLTPTLLRNLRFSFDVEQVADRKAVEVLEEEIRYLKRAQTSTDVNFLTQTSRSLIDNFFHAAHRAHHRPLVLGVMGPIIALLSARIQGIHRQRNGGTKGVVEYFEDFQKLFHNTLYLHEFQRLLAYPPHNEHSWEYSLFRLVEGLSSKIVEGTPLADEIVAATKTLVQQWLPKVVPEGEEGITISQRLSQNYHALSQLVSQLRPEALMRLLRSTEESDEVGFEPLLSESIANHLFDFVWLHHAIPVIRLPSPTNQEYINKAYLSEVFQVAMRRRQSRSTRSLLINLQDRNLWRDEARCRAIEDLNNRRDLDRAFSVISLSSDSEFYHQVGRYEDSASAEEFKADLLRYLTDPEWGAKLPKGEKEMLSSELKACIEALHTGVFGGKNVITRTKRLEWIDLMRTLLIFRMIADCHPDEIFISCKNGLDSTLPTMFGLYAMAALFRGKGTMEEHFDWMSGALLGLPLSKRGRLLFSGRFSRLSSFIHHLEGLTRAELEALHEATSHFLPQDLTSGVFYPVLG
jgi:hypothetical protein